MTVTSPDGSNVPATINRCDDGTADVTFQPSVEGQHVITIMRRGGLPFDLQYLYLISGTATVQQCVANVSADKSAQPKVDDTKINVDCAGPGLLYGIVGIQAGNIDINFAIPSGHVQLVNASLENAPVRKSRGDASAPQKPGGVPPPQKNVSSISRYVSASTRIHSDELRIVLKDPNGRSIETRVC